MSRRAAASKHRGARMIAWPENVPALPLTTPWDRPVGLLLRHAARLPMEPGDPGVDQPLTAAGRSCAEALGVAIATNLRRISTSPLRRCRETAAAICAGAQATLDPLDDRNLGDPGVFVDDDQLAWTHWRDRGHAAVMDHLAWSAAPLPGMAPPERAVRRLFDHIATCLAGSAPGFHLFITHDAILFPTVARTLPAAASRDWWPDFLEAAAIWHDAGRQQFAYRKMHIP